MNVLIKNKRRIMNLYRKKIKGWKSPYKKVSIHSSIDGKPQFAYYYRPDVSRPAPLIVKLHSWHADYTQTDPILSGYAVKAGWNFIHPNFRGKNNNPDACGSNLSMTDINDAIQYCIDNGNVDLNNIFIVGDSGGAYAALCFRSETMFPINSYIVWNPITDLIAWHDQSLVRGSRYHQDIKNATKSTKNLNIEEAKRRSPLCRNLPLSESKLYIFAGYHDGYGDFPVPITHSINYYNKYLSLRNSESNNLIPPEDIIKLSVKEMPITTKNIEGKGIIYQKEFKDEIQITIYNDGHTHISNHTLKLINENLI